ncbi:tRNA pseudouridine(38-40) synthase TruA [Tamlana sp. 2_MG-2023]|uniref:tRNA pseudouridine(38-40) synthase TruA n=1 Tax=unclassified Tamlana TaxID=2614803 RepID=UPI0026E2B774|nr:MULTISPECIES: tRNA pseudouridine(38-40) synthase TruA [unclassified Tamlana]MDO6758712.1 tRNA pseudouridine(38-40) synthase TruA [Tamlana sp. 2_MG-2023]MDO6789411.1 tRNA pseudouridine(38-40) synthase TruA [Tamlana sp. 1_MG-2023]
MRYFLELSYNGKPYHGWQNQPNAISVQEVLEKALSTILGEAISIMGAGRTDAGVHASQMFAHFDTDVVFENSNLLYKLNSYLPIDIAVHDVFKVKPEAHTRFNALSRQYLYRITTKKNVFQYQNTYFVKKPLDIDKMNAACQVLFQYKDFQCFSKSNTDVKTYNCDIMKAEWFYKDDELHFIIKADRFLRNMVRAIVGTMINIGLGKMEVEALHDIIKSKSRCEAGFSVPAHGLFLTHIEYPEDIRY